MSHTLIFLLSIHINFNRFYNFQEWRLSTDFLTIGYCFKLRLKHVFFFIVTRPFNRWPYIYTKLIAPNCNTTWHGWPRKEMQIFAIFPWIIHEGKLLKCKFETGRTWVYAGHKNTSSVLFLKFFFIDIYQVTHRI